MSVYAQQSRNVFKTWTLILLFIGLVCSVFYFLGAYLGVQELTYIGFFVSVFQAFIAYFFGGSIALASAGAKEVTEDKAPQIHEIVNNLAKISGTPKPKIFISPDPSANAFACGRGPSNANICLNQGILDLLNKNELEGVIAHELSHIKNRDTLVMTATAVLSGVISFVVDSMSRLFLFNSSSAFGNDDDNPRSPLAIVIYLVIIILAPILSLLITMAVSREREFLADATAVTMTRYPEGLISALQKLYKSPVPSNHYSSATNHLYISPPKQSWGQKINSLVSTHPTIEERITALSKM